MECDPVFYLLSSPLVQVTGSVCPLQRSLKGNKAGKLPQISSGLAKLLQTCTTQAFLLERPVCSRVDPLQSIQGTKQSIIVRFIDWRMRVKLALIEDIYMFAIHTIPVQATITAASTI